MYTNSLCSSNGTQIYTGDPYMNGNTYDNSISYARQSVWHEIDTKGNIYACYSDGKKVLISTVDRVISYEVLHESVNLIKSNKKLLLCL